LNVSLFVVATAETRKMDDLWSSLLSFRTLPGSLTVAEQPSLVLVATDHSSVRPEASGNNRNTGRISSINGPYSEYCSERANNSIIQA